MWPVSKQSFCIDVVGNSCRIASVYASCIHWPVRLIINQRTLKTVSTNVPSLDPLPVYEEPNANNLRQVQTHSNVYVPVFVFGYVPSVITELVGAVTFKSQTARQTHQF